MADTEQSREAVLDFLQSVPGARAERQCCEERLEELRAECQRVTGAYGPRTGRQGYGRRDALLAQLADLEGELCHAIAVYWDRIREAELFLEALPDPRHRAILRLRYVDGHSWPEVLNRLRELGFWYERSQMLRLHTAALREAQQRYGA